MTPQLLYETVCPACNKAFDVDSDAEEGTCPYCNSYLRFETEEAPPPEPEPKPAARPKRTRKELEPEPEPPAEPQEAPPPRVGEFRVACPACSRGFNVAIEADRAQCPYCESRLQLEDQYAERGVEYPVECPACGRTHAVRLDRARGSCPHCKTALVYDEVAFRAFELPSPKSEPETAQTAPPETTPEAPVVPPAPEPEPPAPEPEAAREESPKPALPFAVAPPEGVPLAVDCPSCKKTFGLPAGTKEGNCPHCNEPLAFVSEKEFDALQEAEERKKQFHQKMAERRQKQKEKELARQKKEEEKPPKEAGALPPTPSKGPLEEPRPPTPTSVEKPSEAKIPAILRKLAFFRIRRKSEPAPTKALAQVSAEIAPLELEEPKPSKETVPPAETIVEFEEVAAPPLAPPKGRKGKAPPTPTVEISVSSVAVPAEVEVAVAPPMPAPKESKKARTAQVGETPIEIATDVDSGPPTESSGIKKRLFGWLRKGTPNPAADDSPAAVIEMGTIEVATARPASAGDQDGRRRAKKKLSTVELGEIDLGPAEPPAAENKARKAKSEPAAATIEAGEIVVAAAPVESAAEVEVSIDLDPAAPSKKGRRR